MSKKDEIIDTALKLFNAYGYNAIGVDRIINESGVAKMTFYKYFSSKAKLIEDCLHQRNLNLQFALNAAIAECDSTDYINHLRTVFYWYDHWFKMEDFNGCMFQKAIEEVSTMYPSTLEPATEYRQWLTARMDSALKGLGIQQSLSLAMVLTSLLDGMTIQAQIKPETVKIEEYWDRVYQLIQLEANETV
ncbi:TetR/AcrR family transcriptional regulator [Acinetobacter chinensis]|uniref:TetR/AcrR family transcriptional regulator n=1 Tax=Acinetobacter chinensis TaxID=2004650 RepID=UPI0029346129|nr:TetR/AcrR family transcriptional regulator [Acinetobacter chinensis]WOE40522.1 TetR/AcrR family transcriptional regulator [Acinetobacter chinensis]